MAALSWPIQVIVLYAWFCNVLMRITICLFCHTFVSFILLEIKLMMIMITNLPNAGRSGVAKVVVGTEAISWLMHCLVQWVRLLWSLLTPSGLLLVPIRPVDQRKAIWLVAGARHAGGLTKCAARLLPGATETQTAWLSVGDQDRDRKNGMAKIGYA